MTQVYDREQGAYADIDPDAAALAASARSASTVEVVEPKVQEPQVFGSVTIAVDDADDPRLASAFGARAGEVAAEHGLTHHEPAGEINALRGTRDDADADETSAAVEITVSGRKILDDVTWLIGPGDRFGIVGANGAGKSTLLKILDGTLTPTAGRVNIGKTVRFAVLSQRLDELEKLGQYKVKEVLSRYKPSYIVDGKEVTPGQLMERLGFEAAQLMTARPCASLCSRSGSTSWRSSANTRSRKC